MWDWLANLLQTPKIRQLEKAKGEAELWGEALELSLKDTERQRDSFKQGFDARGEELLVKQETLRITNAELEEARRQSTDWRYQAETMQLQKEEAAGRIDQLEGEAEEGRKAFHELAERHDSLRAERNRLETNANGQQARAERLEEEMQDVRGQFSAKKQQIGELREGVTYWVDAYWQVRRQSDNWQALYDMKHQQLMDTVDAYREYRQAHRLLCLSTSRDKERDNRQIARLEETVKRKDARLAAAEAELKNAMRRDPKTGRIISRGQR